MNFVSTQIVEQLNSLLRGKIALLMGGTASEREISIKSGNAVSEALTELGLDFVKIDTADKNWWQQIQQCAHSFIAIHGPGGEDGKLQAVLETLGITYTGSGVLASALAMDKRITKQLWQGLGLPTPQFETLHAQSNWQEIMAAMNEVMVKPASEGSSIGMSRVKNADELEAAWKMAAKFDDEVIAEQWVSGPEYTVAVLDGVALTPIRLETDSYFYDFEAKYESNDTRYHCPCGLNDADEEAIKHLALRAFDSLGCSGWGRVDVMRCEQSGEFYLLEVNTVPGMTDHSLVPMAAKHDGLSFSDLIATILAVSLGFSVRGAEQ